ncbi:hypothetical protein SAMN05216251_1272 [Actinacidiphila alni]|uniref:Phosphoadenosine phosphosulfate reductase n=1 Tax=Actinacidiphila alni TaxID=380248 RepID=A0A1I2L557_9ACTN|nr:phosphoadenosine phosphosulfate reductase [Actinacidiphila alni]SFF74482.1 hypothetical protein SAMN05216251_1272 [Actinacidiphila alni]
MNIGEPAHLNLRNIPSVPWPASHGTASRGVAEMGAANVSPSVAGEDCGIRAISFGGGQQSTALLVLAAQGRINFRTFLFANVGDDSESPATLRYVEEYSKPFAFDHGLELTELRRIMRLTGLERTLLQRLEMPESRSIEIPVRMGNGAPGNRACTDQWKIRVVARETARRGATQEHPALIGMGISLDEIHRAKDTNPIPHQRKAYPLLDLGLRRTDCQRIILDAGLPLPPKSACWFCPMKRAEDWQNLRREKPALFARACALESTLNDRRDALGLDHIYLTRYARPLAEAIPDGVDLLPIFDEADGSCDSGWCMT